MNWADVVFLSSEEKSSDDLREHVRKQRQLGLKTLAAISLAALPAILGAEAWKSKTSPEAHGLALASVFFAFSFLLSATGMFLGWFEASLRKRAPEKRFIIGPDDQGDYDDQSNEHWQLDWVEENAVTAIPKAIQWRLANFYLWFSLIISALIFTSGLFVGGLGLLKA